MAEKTEDGRLDEAINYIATINSQLSDELRRDFDGIKNRTIGQEISLGKKGRVMGKLIGNRTALRALLLCQRYYFRKTGGDAWKVASVGYWHGKSKTQIDDAIRLFTATCNTAAALATVAENEGRGPTGKNAVANYTVNRARNQFFDVGSDTCFVAIMAWLLKSGLVSYPWFIRNTNFSGVDNFRKSLGTPRTIWDGSEPFTEGDKLQDVPRGYIINVYNANNPLGFGHWMVSLGDGTAVGCNNTAYDGGPLVPYSKEVPINGLFFNGFNKKNDSGVPKGRADMYDPTKIPGRHMLDRTE